MEDNFSANEIRKNLQQNKFTKGLLLKRKMIFWHQC